MKARVENLSVSSLIRIVFLTASLSGLAFLFVPQAVHAAELVGAIEYVENAGVNITQDGVYQRTQFGSPTDIWR